MHRAVLVLALVAGCKLHFDPLALGSDDGSIPTGDGDSGAGSDTGTSDAPIDGTLATPLVQSASFDIASGGFTINGATGGLAPVTAGNFVMVVCGHPTATGQCNPTSVPTATWQQVDAGTSLGVYIVCGAPAITSITLQNGAGGMVAVVTEWSGVVAANCFDVKRISNPCPTPPAMWTSLATPMVSQNRELIIAAGMASAVDAGYTIDPPYVMAHNAKGSNATANAYTAWRLVNAAPTTYTATGMIQQTGAGLACFNDVFAIKAL